LTGGKFVGALLLLMLAIGGGAYVLSRNGSALECVDKMIEEVASPDGKTLAARLERSCGEGSLATHVLLRTPDAPLRADPLDAVYVAAGRAPVKLTWTSARTLTVEAPRPSISPDKPQWRNIRITVRLIQ
jgi:hypothetical protein